MRPITVLFAALLPAFAAAQPAVDVRFTDLAKFSDLRQSEFANDHDSAAMAEEKSLLEDWLKREFPRAR